MQLRIQFNQLSDLAAATFFISLHKISLRDELHRRQGLPLPGSRAHVGKGPTLPVGEEVVVEIAGDDAVARWRGQRYLLEIGTVKTGECACRKLVATARPTSPCTSPSRPRWPRAAERACF